MKLDVFDLEGVNITIVFDELNRDYISRDQIRRSFQEKPIVHELPDILLVSCEQNKFQAIFDDKRISMNKKIDTGNINLSFLTIARISHIMVNSVEKGSIIAYGYNFNGKAKTNRKINFVGGYFKDKFFKPQPDLERFLNSTMIKAYPRFSFVNQECELNISLDPIDNGREFSFHLNVHYNSPEMPSSDKMHADLITKHELFSQLVAML